MNAQRVRRQTIRLEREVVLQRKTDNGNETMRGEGCCRLSRRFSLWRRCQAVSLRKSLSPSPQLSPESLQTHHMHPPMLDGRRMIFLNMILILPIRVLCNSPLCLNATEVQFITPWSLVSTLFRCFSILLLELLSRSYFHLHFLTYEPPNTSRWVYVDSNLQQGTLNKKKALRC